MSRSGSGGWPVGRADVVLRTEILIDDFASRSQTTHPPATHRMDPGNGTGGWALCALQRTEALSEW
eukprot:scaffold1708_cov117-Isochrysis_galbana.AAC.4